MWKSIKEKKFFPRSIEIERVFDNPRIIRGDTCTSRIVQHDKTIVCAIGLHKFERQSGLIVGYHTRLLRPCKCIDGRQFDTGRIIKHDQKVQIGHVDLGLVLQQRNNSVWQSIGLITRVSMDRGHLPLHFFSFFHHSLLSRDGTQQDFNVTFDTFFVVMEAKLFV